MLIICFVLKFELTIQGEKYVPYRKLELDEQAGYVMS